MTDYIIKKSNGNVLCTIPENSVNTSASCLSLLGKGTIDYGAEENENLVGLLENFANAIPPVNPLLGQLWYDTSSLPYVLKVRNNSGWQDTCNALGQSNLPSGGATVGGNVGGSSRSAGVVSLTLTRDNTKTSIVVIVSEGNIIAALCNEHITVESLPTSIDIDGVPFSFASLFPNGLVNGQSMAVNKSFYGIFRQPRDPIASDELATKHYADVIDTRITNLTPSLVPQGLIAMWSGSADNIPQSWVLCNGQNNAPDLRDRFIIGAGNSFQVGTTGGSNNPSATTSESGIHSHTAQALDAGAHNHGGETGGHALSNEEIPSHTHKLSMTSFRGSILSSAGYTSYSIIGTSSELTTEPTGGNNTHDHPIPIQADHTHTVNVNNSAPHAHTVSINILPPYYSLCFIKKV